MLLGDKASGSLQIKPITENSKDGEQGEKADIEMKEEVKEEAKKPTPRYEYYIHYVGIPRRNDRWLPEESVRQDEDECKRLMAEIEKKEREAKENEEFLFNNEHLGLTDK